MSKKDKSEKKSKGDGRAPQYGMDGQSARNAGADGEDSSAWDADVDDDDLNLDDIEDDEDDLDPDDIRVTLDLDDGTKEECAILTIFSMGDRDYIALLPTDDEGEPICEGDVYLYRYHEDEDGTPSIDNIEDDGEFDAVSERFDELVEELDDGEE